MISQNIRRRYLSTQINGILDISLHNKTVTAASGSLNITVTLNNDTLRNDAVIVTFGGECISNAVYNSSTGIITISYGSNTDLNNNRIGYVFVNFKEQQQIFTLTQKKDEFVEERSYSDNDYSYDSSSIDLTLSSIWNYSSSGDTMRTAYISAGTNTNVTISYTEHYYDYYISGNTDNYRTETRKVEVLGRTGTGWNSTVMEIEYRGSYNLLRTGCSVGSNNSGDWPSFKLSFTDSKSNSWWGGRDSRKTSDYTFTLTVSVQDSSVTTVIGYYDVVWDGSTGLDYTWRSS